jgi:hypothetical protein
MAATVIDDYSDELTPSRPPLYGPVGPDIQHGRVRVHYWTMTFATEAAGLDVAVALIPKGARILGGEACVDATTGTATLSYGLSGKDASGYIDAANSVSDDVAALKATTAKVVLAATQALKYGYKTEKELWLTVTTGTAAMASQKLTGHILYVVD